MADNYSTYTGVVHFKQYTPVLSHLFEMYDIDPSFPGNGVAYIGKEDMGYTLPYWEAFIENMTKWCQDELNLAVVVPDETPGAAIEVLVHTLVNYFNLQQPPDVRHLLADTAGVDYYDEVPLQWLFQLAQLLNDGHGLSSFEIEGAHWCSKPRLWEFGGYSQYYSPRVHYYKHSSQELYGGRIIDEALSSGNHNQAAREVVRAAESVINSIQNEEDRKKVTQHVVTQLRGEDPAIPAGQPASNDGGNAYENLPAAMTPQEQTERLANALAHISRDRYGQMPEMKADEAARQAMVDTIQLLQHGDLAYGVPPMQLVPIMPEQHHLDYDGSAWRDGKGNVAVRWNYDQPMPLVGEGTDLLNAFDDTYKRFQEARANAAKKMFGT